MKPDKSLFNPATSYQIMVQGRVDVEWLQSFDSSVEVQIEKTRQSEEITVLSVHTDQAGMVGLVRRLHGFGMGILQVQVVSNHEQI